MSGQAEQLQQTMSFFKLDSASGGNLTVRKSSAGSKKTAVKAAAHKATAKPASGGSAELDESQFSNF